MRIRDVEAVRLRAGDASSELFDGSYDVCLLRVTTDEGIEGIGETESFPAAVAALVRGPSSHRYARALRDVLIGRDPLDPRARWHEMYEATSYVGRRGIVMHAMGGVDLALWDLKGKAEGRPVSELLGRPLRDRIPVYATIYPLPADPEAARRQIAEARARGIRAFKVCAEPAWLDDLARTRELLAAVREEAGPEARLIVDAALAYESVEDGLRLLPLLESAGVWLLEAPLPLDDVDGHRRLAGHGVALGVGDLGLSHADEFREFAGAADVWQPDLSMVGGLVGAERVAQAARELGVQLVPHAYKTTILIAANAHFLAVQPDDDPLMEYSLSPSPLRWRTTIEELPVEPDGTVLVPARPGLGVTLDEETVARYRVDESAR